MSTILESDIIYNVLSYIDFRTIGNIFCVSKLVNNLCNDKHFWKNKFMNDYHMVIPKSDNWLYEYKCISLVNIQTIKIVKYLISVDAGCRLYYPQFNMQYAIRIHNTITNPHLYWIPDNLKRMVGKGLSSVEFKVLTHDMFSIIFTMCAAEVHSIYMNQHELINYMTRICYDYKDVVIFDNITSYLFSDYPNKKM